MATQPPPISSQAISDGEPEALAALCSQRGGSVLAYCDHVAAPRQAGAAAADAFARLRAEVFEAHQAASEIDVEARLMSATRNAAMAHGVVSTGSLRDSAIQCSGRESALIAQLEQSLEPAESLKLDEHVSGCAACSRVSRRLEAGQRAFDSPPRAPVPPRVAEQLIAALVAAAPLTALGGDADAVRARVAESLDEASNGSNLAPPPSSEAETAPSADSQPAATPITASVPEPAVGVQPHLAALPGQAVAEQAATQADPASAAASPSPGSGSETPVAHPSPQQPAQDPSRQRASSSRRSSRRHSTATEAPRLRALISRVPGTGAPQGSTIARRQSPLTVQGRSAELAAVTLFMLVASTVALVTFLIAS